MPDRSGVGNGSGQGQTEGKISEVCKGALKKAGLLKKVESLWKTAKVYDINKIGADKGENYFGKGARGMTVEQYFVSRTNDDPGDGMAYSSWGSGPGLGRRGIYARGGLSGMSDSVRTHETTHLAYPVGRDYDISLAAKLKIPYEKTGDKKKDGDNASNAVSDFFNNDCKKQGDSKK